MNVPHWLSVCGHGSIPGHGGIVGLWEVFFLADHCQPLLGQFGKKLMTQSSLDGTPQPVDIEELRRPMSNHGHTTAEKYNHCLVNPSIY